tara:strand:- start:4022 stop:4228 length:207 start_codon:yes stop_codon:yes gene_type:complete
MEELERKARARAKARAKNQRALAIRYNQIAHRATVAPELKEHHRNTVWTLETIGKTDTIPNWTGKIRW